MGYDVGTTDKLLDTDIDAADLLTATAQALRPKTARHVAAGRDQRHPDHPHPQPEDGHPRRASSACQPAGRRLGPGRPRSTPSSMVKRHRPRSPTGTTSSTCPGSTRRSGRARRTSPRVRSPSRSSSPPSGQGPVNAPLYGTVAKTSQVALQVQAQPAPLLGLTCSRPPDLHRRRRVRPPHRDRLHRIAEHLDRHRQTQRRPPSTAPSWSRHPPRARCSAPSTWTAPISRAPRQHRPTFMPTRPQFPPPVGPQPRLF